MMKHLNILFLVLALTVAFMPQKAQAMDPVTIAILAPIAIKAAEAARPYVIRGMINLGKGFVKIFKSAFGIVYLPYGLGKMMFGWPWGGFRSGVIYTMRGLIAPCKMIFHTILLPLYTVGLQINNS
ncbi:MAG: hypothetical protein J6S24_00480 [Lentisphaeria bacterium]|nr:hypothetical protein [Lentisphaerota bacterium]MBO5645273.1 hypothetical protein [Lentisphaeria bacterium]MBO5764735.1 hypothetical protein [Lentisphaeria bacterium]MBO5991213.1 hypothetical protein [Lentisphaeria bacterium]MBO7153295.1 hypothetical protein [Lentisphaeria bacterium]